MLGALPRAILYLGCLVYRGFLHAYPREFRARFGAEMRQVFHDQLRDTLSSQGILGLLQFSFHIACDLSMSILRERLTSISILGIICSAAAICFGLGAAYVDRHNASEVYPTLFVVMVSSFLLGVVRPLGAWRWALIVGLAVPFAGSVVALPSRLASPGHWAILAVVLIPGLIGAYTGVTLRWAVGELLSELK
jgi:cytochrome c oxidase subunit IV